LYPFEKGRFSGYNPPKLTISDTGFYDTYIQVYDSLGCIFPLNRRIEGGNLPVARFVIDTNIVFNREGVILTNTSPGPIHPTEYYWAMAGLTGEFKIWSPVLKELPDKYPIITKISFKN
jgi:hypothetical protein